MYEEFMDPEESDEALLHALAEESYDELSPDEMVGGFVERTSMLTPGEQAFLLGSAIEGHGGAGRSGQSPGPFGGNVFNAVGAIGGITQAVAGITGGLAQLIGGNDPTAQRIAQVANVIGQTAGVVGGVVQGIGGMFTTPRPGQVAPLPGRRPPQRAPAQPAPARRAPARPAPARPAPARRAPARRAPARRAPARPAPARPAPARPAPARPAPARPAPAPRAPAQPAGGQLNAAALMSMLNSNPQLLQSLRSALVLGRSGRREVVLEVPDSEGAITEVAIPLGAVMNTIATLATEAMAELNANTHEADPEVPEYLLTEDGEYIVDPANSEDRAALVMHYFRAAHEAERNNAADDEGDFGFEGDFDSFAEAGDDVDEWTDDFGF